MQVAQGTQGNADGDVQNRGFLAKDEGLGHGLLQPFHNFDRGGTGGDFF